MNKFILSFILSSSIPAMTEMTAPSLTAQQYNEKSELQELSKWIETLQQGLYKEEGITHIYIGGGSARAILDHIYFEKSLKMRDLDIFVVADRQVDADFARNLGQKLESKELGTFAETDLRSRPRAPTNKPILERNTHRAGYGFFWVSDTNEILDLSLYHSQEDLNTNGIFDIDTIMIVLDHQTRLLDFVQKAKHFSYDELVSQGFIRDDHKGYNCWLKQDPHVVNWIDIEKDPLQSAFRLARTFGKSEKESFPSIVKDNLEYLISTAEVKNSLQMTRLLLKVLEDPFAAHEIKMVQSVGAFKKWLPHLDAELQKYNAEEIELILANSQPSPATRSSKELMGKMKALFELVKNPQERAALIYDGAYAFSPETTLFWLSEIYNFEIESAPFFNAMSHFFIDSPESARRFERLTKSKTVQNKAELFQRALLLASNNQEALLEELFPDGDHEKLRALAATPRVGYYTGAFNPMHKGHIGVVRHALTEGILDKIIVIPTVGTNHNDPLVPWEDRLIMAHLALSKIPDCEVINKSYKRELTLNTNAALSRLFKENAPETKWTHVMGTDSFERFVKNGIIERANLGENLGILVIHRPGYQLYPAPEKFLDYVKLYTDKNEEETPIRYSSSGVRENRLENLPIDHLVDPAVAEYIVKKELYTESAESQGSLTFITTNDGKYLDIKTLFPSIKRKTVDLPKMQDVSIEDLVKAKLLAALDYKNRNVVILESFLFIDDLAGLPGPLTKEFLLNIENEQLERLLDSEKPQKAHVRTIIGYAKNPQEVHFFEYDAKGYLKKGSYFEAGSWENIFAPEGSEKPLSEMSSKEKAKYSPVIKAGLKLKEYLDHS